MERFLHEPWRAERPALGFWCSIGDSFTAEALAASGADYVCVDMQHGGTNEANLVAMLQGVTAGGSVPLVRVADSNAASIMKVLDAGARGVVVPLVESREQAEAAIAACRYPPAGTRSFGPFRAQIQANSADPRQLEQVACVAMIETRAGIDHLEEIVRADGLSAIYVGPSDLSLALGLPPGSFESPEFVETLEQIRAACAAQGIVAGIHCYEGATAARFVEQGFGMVTVSVDMRLLRAAAGGELGRARGARPPGAVG